MIKSEEKEVRVKLRSMLPGEYQSRIETPKNSLVINSDYDRSYDNHVVRENGLVHPGIYLSREELNIMRDMVWLGAEPWAAAFESLQKSSYASLDYKMDGPAEYIQDDKETYALTRGSSAAYELTLMWYITGDTRYAQKARHIIISWSNMLKEDKNKDHIRMGTTLHKFTIAAEIMRYTPSSGWTDKDTQKLYSLLEKCNASVDKPEQYYNQGSIALMGYMGSAIFRCNYEDYARSIERITYNVRGGINHRGHSINYSLAAMFLNSGQFVEMGRDQAHAGGDLSAATCLVKTALVQGTRVDYFGNIVESGIPVIEYGGDKLLKGVAYHTRYNRGEEISYIPGRNGLGQPIEYCGLNPDCRGRDFWHPVVYHYYANIKKVNPEQTRPTYGKTTLEIFTQMFPHDVEKIRNDPHIGEYGLDDSVDEYRTYGEMLALAALNRSNEESAVDWPARGDLTCTPLAAIEDTPFRGAPQDIYILPNSYPLWNRCGGDDFIGTGNGIRETINSRRNGGLLREPFLDDGEIHYSTSDANNGEWVAYQVDFDVLGSTAEKPANKLRLAYSSHFHGPNGTTADAEVWITIADWVEEATFETYQKAIDEGKSCTFRVKDAGGFHIFLREVVDLSALPAECFTGKKTIYFEYVNSVNVYRFHINTLWYKFATAHAADENPAVRADSTTGIRKESAVELADGQSLTWDTMDFDNGFVGMAANVQYDGSGGELCCLTGGQVILKGTLTAGRNFLKTAKAPVVELYGKQKITLQFRGEGVLSIHSVTFPSVSVTADYKAVKGNSFSYVSYGEAKADGNGVLLKLGTQNVIPYARENDENYQDSVTVKGSKVVYRRVAFLSGPGSLKVKVRSNAACTLEFLQMNSGKGYHALKDCGCNASQPLLTAFQVPDTKGEWITLENSLKGTLASTLSGEIFVGLYSYGENAKRDDFVEVDYFRLNLL